MIKASGSVRKRRTRPRCAREPDPAAPGAQVLILETISYALAVNELTAELLVDRLDPRDITVSADGRLVAFVAAPVGQPEEHPRNAVWLAQSDVPDSARRFTSGTADDRGPQFAPDGTSLYFLSDREERKVAQLYRVSLEGGEARPLTEGKPGIAAYARDMSGATFHLMSSQATPCALSAASRFAVQGRGQPACLGHGLRAAPLLAAPWVTDREAVRRCR